MLVARTAVFLLLTSVALGFVPSTTTSRSICSGSNRNNVSIRAFGIDPTTQTTIVSSTSSSASTPSTSSGTRLLKGAFAECHQQAKTMLTKSIGEENTKILQPLLHFCEEYFLANQDGYEATGNAASDASTTMARILKGIQLGMTYGMGENKYTFGVAHKALRGDNPDAEGGNTYDYYQFGCDFFRPCMNLPQSVVMGQDNLQQAFKQMANGENVVFLANHQSEADPQVFSCLLESVGFADQAQHVTYVAGHKVTTDPLAIPFSMGRNLICIHSKKHIDADPETKPRKQKQNIMAMGGLLSLFKAGSCALWVAPSGGRDRRDVDTGKVPIAPFDSKTIDMFRLMGTKSKKLTHYYPLSMVTYDLCPPPDYIEAGVGEQRNVRFVPVGIACGPEVISEGGLEGRHEFCEHAQAICQQGYEELLQAMSEKQNA